MLAPNSLNPQACTECTSLPRLLYWEGKMRWVTITLGHSTRKQSVERVHWALGPCPPFLHVRPCSTQPAWSRNPKHTRPRNQKHTRPRSTLHTRSRNPQHTHARSRNPQHTRPRSPQLEPRGDGTLYTMATHNKRGALRWTCAIASEGHTVKHNLVCVTIGGAASLGAHWPHRSGSAGEGRKPPTGPNGTLTPGLQPAGHTPPQEGQCTRHPSAGTACCTPRSFQCCCTAHS
jgi:hypothetical protein